MASPTTRDHSLQTRLDLLISAVGMVELFDDVAELVRVDFSDSGFGVWNLALLDIVFDHARAVVLRRNECHELHDGELAQIIKTIAARGSLPVKVGSSFSTCWTDGAFAIIDSKAIAILRYVPGIEAANHYPQTWSAVERADWYPKLFLMAMSAVSSLSKASFSELRAGLILESQILGCKGHSEYERRENIRLARCGGATWKLLAEEFYGDPSLENAVKAEIVRHAKKHNLELPTGTPGRKRRKS